MSATEQIHKAAVFNQPHTVITSAHLWIPYSDLAPPFAQKISANPQFWLAAAEQ